MQNFLYRVRRRLRTLFGRNGVEAEMLEEMRFHLEQRTAENLECGLNESEAALAAQRRFGNLGLVREQAREASYWTWFEDGVRDSRQAFRSLRRSPLLALAGVGTLGLCLAANLALLAVIDSVLLAPLPLPESDRLVTSYNSYPKAGVPNDGSSVANYYDYRGAIPAFESLALFQEQLAITGHDGAADRISIARVTPEFFDTLRSPVVRGRTFTEDELAPNAERVAVVTPEFAEAHLQRTTEGDFLGAMVQLDGRDARVVGVLNRGFQFLDSEAGVFVPLSSHGIERQPQNRHSGGGSRMLVARLREGATPDVAESQVRARYEAIASGDKEFKAMEEAGFRAPVVSLKAHHVAHLRTPLLLLQTAVFLLLTIGCVNLVNLLLIRASAREKELAVRSALGASRRHVVRSAFAETLVLTTGGAALGLLGAMWSIGLLKWLEVIPPALSAVVHFEPRLLWLMAVVSLGLALALAFPVALFGMRTQLSAALAGETRTSTAGRAANRMRNGFVIAQVALSFLLLAGAGLLASGLRRTLAIHPGFGSRGVISAELTLSSAKYADSRSRAAFARDLSNSGSVDENRVVGVGTNIPFSRHDGKTAVVVVGYERPPNVPVRAVNAVGVGGAYFQALGAKLLCGRFLDDADSGRLARVCVVDEAFAQFYWGDADPLGKRLFPGGEIAGRGLEESFEVVGVVSTMKRVDLAERDQVGTVFYPLVHRSEPNLYVLARTMPARPLTDAALRELVQAVDRSVPVSDVRSLEARIDDSTQLRRSSAVLTSAFALVALVLSAIGIFGVSNHSIQQRRRDIAIRVALGAAPGGIQLHFVRAGCRLLGLGMGIGLLAAIGAKGVLDRVIPGVPSYDIGALLGSALAIAGILLLAVWMPARAASRLDPMQELRRG